MRCGDLSGGADTSVDLTSTSRACSSAGGRLGSQRFPPEHSLMPSTSRDCPVASWPPPSLRCMRVAAGWRRVDTSRPDRADDAHHTGDAGQHVVGGRPNRRSRIHPGDRRRDGDAGMVAGTGDRRRAGQLPAGRRRQSAVDAVPDHGVSRGHDQPRNVDHVGERSPQRRQPERRFGTRRRSRWTSTASSPGTRSTTIRARPLACSAGRRRPASTCGPSTRTAGRSNPKCSR